MSLPILLVLVVCLIALLSSVEAVPPGFVDEEVASLLLPAGRAIAFSFVPKQDGGHAMLLSAKFGQLHLIRDPDKANQVETEMILDLSERMCTDFSRGLQQVIPHPNFSRNGWIYMFYTVNKYESCEESYENGPVNRVSRFVMNQQDFTIDVETEQVLLETPSLLTGLHHGGDMAFGKDGFLYITIGDGGDRRGAVSQNVSNVFGSILRLTDRGNIPADNPFTTANGYTSARCHKNGEIPHDVFVEGNNGTLKSVVDKVYCEEIYAYGLRNPFRFGFDPNTEQTRALINDVGNSRWEETNELIEGANYGWPDREGPCELDSFTYCDGSHNFTDPLYYYHHIEEGGAVVGIAFVPNGLWPEEYDNTVIFSDYVFDTVYQLKEDPEHACSTCLPPIPGWKNTTFHKYQRIVQMTFGPYKDTQALYYLALRGSSSTLIRRIYYVGGDNGAPVAVMNASRTQGLLEGVEVEFDASGSSDPDGDEITFAWDFGDGTTEETGTNSIATHQYLDLGVFTVSLTVTDTNGLSDTVQVEITVGEPPAVTIESPVNGTEFAVGDVLTLKGSAVDKKGKDLGDQSLSWEVRLHHNTHYHPFLDSTTGNDIVLHGAPSPEDFLAATSSHLEIILTATDQDGVRASASRVVMPKRISLEFDSEPSGLTLVLDGFSITTPTEVVSWENHQLQAMAPDQAPWKFVSWSNNEPQMHYIEVPALVERQVPRFVARFEMDVTAQPSLRPTAAPTKSETLNPPDLGSEFTSAAAGRSVVIGSQARALSVAALLVAGLLTYL